ncbi:MAG: response regulator [Bacteroidales bacterium]
MLTIKVAFCDNDLSSRETMKILLKRIPFIEIYGEYHNSNDLIEKLKKKSPHIVFYNLQTNKLNDIEGIKKILVRNPSIKVIVTSTFEDFRTIAVVFSVGAFGFLAKKELSVINILKAIQYSTINNYYLSTSCELKINDINKIIQLN